MSSFIALSNYDYQLKNYLIATKPANPPDSSRLLVYNRDTKTITHSTFKYICNFIPKNTNIILNNTKVLKAKLKAQKTNGVKCELLYLEHIDEFECEVFIKGKVKKNDKLFIDIGDDFDNNFYINICELKDGGIRIVEFYFNELKQSKDSFYKQLKKYGTTPLSPYIDKQRKIQKQNNHTNIKINDEKSYQSLFASINGSVAAPTASLHFTPKLLHKLKKTFDIFYTTLHIGAGTFKPIESENVLEHKMHSETYNINNDTINLINSSKKILCIGTTSARSIETYVQTKKSKGRSEIFLHPLNKAKRVDYLLTNFHLPKSTLLLLVASFVGDGELKRIYQEAICKQYKFFSYGDSLLIL